MRYTFILLFALSSYIAAFSQNSKPAPAPVISRYYNFTGTIDKYPVTFHLYRINDKFTGSYYYNNAENASHYMAGSIFNTSRNEPDKTDHT